MSSLLWLDPDNYHFPDPERALLEPNGLLAAGGDLSPERIFRAYQTGIFPWYEEGQPILWWSPDPRMVLFPNELHLSRSLKKAIRKTQLQITFDLDFKAVLEACAGGRSYSSGTWLTNEMIAAYLSLHQLGIAHSIEAWHNDKLVGGLYGLAIDKVFYGESMFSHEDNASKIAFAHFVQTLESHHYKLIDCQIASPYLESFGAREISRAEFTHFLPNKVNSISNTSAWGIE